MVSGSGSVSLTSSTGDLTLSPSTITGTGTIDLDTQRAEPWTANQTAPSFIASGSGAGSVVLTNGTAPGAVSNAVQLIAPATVTLTGLQLRDASGRTRRDHQPIDAMLGNDHRDLHLHDGHRRPATAVGNASTLTSTSTAITRTTLVWVC